jgi:hypothetical protein
MVVWSFLGWGMLPHVLMLMNLAGRRDLDRRAKAMWKRQLWFGLWGIAVPFFYFFGPGKERR